MEEILGLVAEVEQKAVTIINLAKEEKAKLKQESILQQQEFEADKKKKYEKMIRDYKESLDTQAQVSLQQIEKESLQNQMKLKDYYDSEKGNLVRQLQQQVIGE